MKNLLSVLRSDEVEDDLIQVIETIIDASKEIAFRVRQGALAGVLGSTQDENIQGETQKHLDIISNQLLKDLLLACTPVAAIASEEEDTVVAANSAGKYVVAFDPLDGSSNIDINGQIGTIFSIYHALDLIPHHSELQFHQQGRPPRPAGSRSRKICAGVQQDAAYRRRPYAEGLLRPINAACDYYREKNTLFYFGFNPR